MRAQHGAKNIYMSFLFVWKSGGAREPAGPRRSPGASRVQEEPGGARMIFSNSSTLSHHVEDPEVKRSTEEPGRARRSQEEARGARVNEGATGGAR